MHVISLTRKHQQVDFQQVKFLIPYKRSITITNTGQGPCRFEFINQPGKKKFCAPWLTVVRSTGLLMASKCSQLLLLPRHLQTSTDRSCV